MTWLRLLLETISTQESDMTPIAASLTAMEAGGAALFGLWSVACFIIFVIWIAVPIILLRVGRHLRDSNKHLERLIASQQTTNDRLKMVFDQTKKGSKSKSIK